MQEDAHFRAFLDQGRWLLAEQQRRRDSFRTTAATMLGFDGLALTLIVGLAPSDARVAGVALAGAVAVALSALFAVLACFPKETQSVGVKDTLDGWVQVRHGTVDYSPTQYFAEMLLTTPDARAGDPDEGENGDAQALRASVAGADRDGTLLAWSARSLLLAIVLLVAAVAAQAIQTWI